jgi:hypothetical protein
MSQLRSPLRICGFTWSSPLLLLVITYLLYGVLSFSTTDHYFFGALEPHVMLRLM